MSEQEPKPKLEEHASNRTRLEAGTWLAIWAGASAATVTGGLKAVVALPGRVRWVPHCVGHHAILATRATNALRLQSGPTSAAG